MGCSLFIYLLFIGKVKNKKIKKKWNFHGIGNIFNLIWVQLNGVGDTWRSGFGSTIIKGQFYQTFGASIVISNCASACCAIKFLKLYIYKLIFYSWVLIIIIIIIFVCGRIKYSYFKIYEIIIYIYIFFLLINFLCMGGLILAVLF